MASAAPWLSVVVPVHDGERWLRETLESVASQIEPGVECIVIDSSPGPATADLVRTFESRLTLRLFHRPDLEHWRSKTNWGFSVAAAPQVCMLHQDDFWLPGRVAAVREWVRAAPLAVMHLHPTWFVDEASQRRGLWRCPLAADQGPVSPQQLLERLLVQNFISVPTPVIARSAFEAVGGIDESLWYTGDWDLYLKLAKAGAVHYHSQPLTAFRVHPGSLSATQSLNLADFEAQLRQVLNAHLLELPATRQAAVRRLAEASVEVNLGLAAASHGQWGGLARVLRAAVALGPRRLPAYLRDSRIVERLRPRLLGTLRGGP